MSLIYARSCWRSGANGIMFGAPRQRGGGADKLVSCDSREDPHIGHDDHPTFSLDW